MRSYQEIDWKISLFEACSTVRLDLIEWSAGDIRSGPGQMFNFGSVVPSSEVGREAWSQTGELR